ncbi:MAG: isoprenylcysteine carboxylmethyltransferase family protein [Anaerolineae bacterium]|nr:isoprenylcysteine carboxylmethyltransferase family protein [Anaerolineae bacterium]
MDNTFVRALVLVVPSSALILIAGGGLDFLRRPVGAIYLALWALWWLALALGRPRGVRSAYNRRQRVVVGLGVVALVLLVVGPPWEYTHFDGPIPRDGPLAWLGLFLFGAGIALQTAALWTLHGLYTSRLGIQTTHRLVTHGVYRVVRHPGYLSNIMSMTGIGLALSSLVGLALAILVVPLILWRIAREEEMLITEFGDAYRAYMQRTRRLVPLVY